MAEIDGLTLEEAIEIIKWNTCKPRESMLVSEQEYIKEHEFVEEKYKILAEGIISQLVLSLNFKCKEFDSQNLIAMWLKKNKDLL